MDESTVIIRASWFQPAGLAIFAVLLGFFVFLSVAEPHDAVVYALFFLAILAMGGAQLAVTRVVITGDTVVFDQGRFTPKRQAARHRLRSVQCFPLRTALADSYGEQVLPIYFHLSMKQLQGLAITLNVPLYDHRRWLGLRSAQEGRLITAGKDDTAQQPG
jgi:hypothetical protein